MPTLVLKPFMEIIITGDQEKKVLEFMQGDRELMTLNKTTFHRTAFSYIKPGGVTEPDLRLPNRPDRRLKADNRTDTQQFKAARKASEIARKRLKKAGVLK